MYTRKNARTADSWSEHERAPDYPSNTEPFWGFNPLPLVGVAMVGVFFLIRKVKAGTGPATFEPSDGLAVLDESADTGLEPWS